MKTYRPNSTAHQALTVTTTAQTLAQLGVTLDSGTDGIVLQAESGDVRFTTNGTTTPTTTVGFICREFDQPLPLTRAEAENLKLISNTGSDVTVQFAEYRELP